ncbi:MAG TPA: hypothetical protein VIV60_29005 [Polyangiaceae bacterium]
MRLKYIDALLGPRPPDSTVTHVRLPSVPIHRIAIRGPLDGDEASGHSEIIRHKLVELKEMPGKSNSPAPTLGELFTSGAEHFDLDDGTAASVLEVIGGSIRIEQCTCDRGIRISLHDGRLVVCDSTISGVGHVEWSEYVARTDGTTRSVAFASIQGTILVSAVAGDRPNKYAEQEQVARRIASAISRREQISYAVIPEPPGGNDYPDATLIAHGGRLVQLQIRHFHDIIARGLRGPQREIVKVCVDDICEILQSAIDTKASIDADVRARTHLVLWSPISLGDICRARISSGVFDVRGFECIWFCSFREEPFLIGR